MGILIKSTWPATWKSKMAATFQDGRQTDVPKIVFALDMYVFGRFRWFWCQFLCFLRCWIHFLQIWAALQWTKWHKITVDSTRRRFPQRQLNSWSLFVNNGRWPMMTGISLRVDVQRVDDVTLRPACHERRVWLPHKSRGLIVLLTVVSC